LKYWVNMSSKWRGIVQESQVYQNVCKRG